MDFQTGHEKTITALLPALAGANLLYGSGMIEMGMTFDFGQLVLDNDVAKMVRSTLGGIPVNDETLGVDLIKEIGIGKDYLSHEKTYEHMRIQSAPQCFNRRMYENWENAGKPDIYREATAKAAEILETHTPDPLPDGAAESIRSIIEEAEAELGIDYDGGDQWRK